MLRRLWSRWRKTLILVQPDTVVGWHRAGFKLYWKWISQSRVRVGRRPTSKEIRELIFRMIAENPMWGAPRIHGELQMLGFEISEQTVLRWMRKTPKDPEPATRWAVFPRNHRSEDPGGARAVNEARPEPLSRLGNETDSTLLHFADVRSRLRLNLTLVAGSRGA